jgi:hypothetical protein
MDIDNPGDCPKCIELGLTEIQQLRKKLADWVEHEDLAPHEGCYCRYCVVLSNYKNLTNKLAKAHDELARLRADRDKLLETNNTLWTKMTAMQRHELNLLWRDNV